jgi:hypothetical protein
MTSECWFPDRFSSATRKELLPRIYRSVIDDRNGLEPGRGGDDCDSVMNIIVGEHEFQGRRRLTAGGA